MVGASGALALAEDARRYKRIKPGRRAVLQIAGEWLPCRIVEISGGGASVEVEDLAGVVNQVVLGDPELGMIAATVQRQTPGCLALSFGIERGDKERLIDALTGLLNADLL